MIAGSSDVVGRRAEAGDHEEILSSLEQARYGGTAVEHRHFMNTFAPIRR